MNRREALAVSVASGFALTGVSRAADKPPVADQTARLTEGERLRLEDGAPVVTKTFIAALRERLTDEKAAKLREFVDPRYLEEHGLQDGAFPIQRVVTGDIHSNHLSQDPTTAVVVARTEGGEKECFVFRLAVHEGKVYIVPFTAPDAKTKSFSPWILRVRV